MLSERLTITLLQGRLAVDEHVDVSVHAGSNADVSWQARAQVADRSQQPLLCCQAEGPGCRELPGMRTEAPAAVSEHML